MPRFFLVVILLFPLSLFAQRTANGTFAVSRIAIAPLSSALAGSQIASYADDVNQLAVNPGFYDEEVHQDVSLGYLNYLAGINQASLAYAHVWDSVGIVSGYLRYFDYGTFQETNESGAELGEFKAADYELGINFSRPYGDRLSYGATFKQYFSSMYQYFAYGVALDLGAYYHSDGGFAAGLVVDDIGWKMVDYTGASNELLPVSVNIAVAKSFDKAPLRFGLQYNHLEQWDLGASDANALNDLRIDPLTGEEERRVFTADNLARHLALSVAFTPSDAFNLMVGYDFRKRLELAISERPGLVGFSLGARVHIKRFGLQYAITSYHLGGASNHLAITTNLEEWRTKKAAP